MVDLSSIDPHDDKDDTLVTRRELEAHIASSIDRVKLWLMMVVVANLLPLIFLGYTVGEWNGRIETQLAVLNAQPVDYSLEDHNVYAREVDRRLSRIERLVDQGAGR